MTMKDRLKFRVWDEEKKTYKSLDAPFYCCSDGTILDTHFDIRNNDVLFEQCVGLKDKNGKLIYEGDIVKINLDDYGGNHVTGTAIASVKWAKNGFEVNSFLFELGTYWLLEIIGNIHENGDLLNE